ncbi:MAG: hypothetical protein QNJ60_10780 [Xenococcaceae cyanobacterium MO_188.B19]|nr:hypothetical protein [Xenococcaceae cyanobacterium MO_188.B19]
MKLYFHDDKFPNLEWKVNEPEVGSVDSRDQEQRISQKEIKNSYSQKLTCKAISDDELREASIRQRVRIMENHLFDEYGDEPMFIHPTNN